MEVSSSWANDEARFESARAIVRVKYMTVASCTVLVLDWLLMLDLEVALIWSRKWSFVKLIYFLARYQPVLDVPLSLAYFFAQGITPKFIQDCIALNISSAILTGTGITWTEIILVIRTYAITGRGQGFLCYLSIQLLAVCLASAVIMGVTFRTLTYGPSPEPTVPGCYNTGGTMLFVNFILLLVHEFIVMGIMLTIGFRRYRHHRTPLINTLYVDGTLYFVCILLVSLANITNIAINSDDYLDLFTMFQRVMHSVLSSRMLLHVRQAADTSGRFEVELSAIRFTSLFNKAGLSEGRTNASGTRSTVAFRDPWN